MSHILRNLTVQFGSLVDAPANKGAQIMLFKRDDDATAVAALTDAVAGVSKVGRKLAGPRMAALKVAIEHLNQILSECADPAPDDQTKEPDMAKKSDASVVEETAEVTPESAPVVEKAETVKAETVDVSKQLADLEKRAAAAEKRAQDAEGIAKAERDARLTGEFVGKAAKYDKLSQKPAEFGPVLKRAADALSAEDYAELDRVLSAANEQVGKSNLFAEVGKADVEDGESATERLNKAALDLIEKGTHKDYASALSAVSKSNPQLAAAYVAEQRARN